MGNQHIKTQLENKILAFFNYKIHNKEKQNKLSFENFNPTVRKYKLLEKEIKYLILDENIKNNLAKAHRLLEVYKNSMDLLTNLKWYKHYKTFKQEYLYEFSEADKLKNEEILRRLVVDRKFLNEYNAILEYRGLKVILADQDKLYKPLKEDINISEKKILKYRKYVNELMPFITTIFNEKNQKKEKLSLKKEQVNFTDLNDNLIENIFNFDNKDETINEIINIFNEEENERINENNNKIINENNNEIYSLNVAINMYDLKEIFLFGEVRDTLPKNPSRREQDRLKKFFNRTNLMKLIKNSEIIVPKTELNAKINEHKLIINNIDDLEIIYYQEKDSETNILETKSRTLKEHLRQNFSNALIKLGINDTIEIIENNSLKKIKKDICYFYPNDNLKTNFNFKSTLNLNSLFSMIVNDFKVNKEVENNNLILKISKIYTKINQFLEKNRDILKINTIDFLIYYIHFIFALYQCQFKNEDEQKKYISDELKKIKNTDKNVNIYNSFYKLIEMIANADELKNEKEFEKLILIEKNNKKKRSKTKEKYIKFFNFFEVIQEYENLILNEFQEINNINFHTFSQDKEKLKQIVNYIFLVFVCETYLTFPNYKKRNKEKEKNEFYSEKILNRLSKINNILSNEIKESIKSINKKVNSEKEKEKIENLLKKEENLNQFPKITNFFNYDISPFQINIFEKNISIEKEISKILNYIPCVQDKEILNRLNIENNTFLVNEVLKKQALFSIKLTKKIEKNKEINYEETYFYFNNIYDITTFIYLKTCIFYMNFEEVILNNSDIKYPNNVKYRKNENLDFEIIFKDKETENLILNIIEIYKIILRKLNLKDTEILTNILNQNILYLKNEEKNCPANAKLERHLLKLIKSENNYLKAELLYKNEMYLFENLLLITPFRFDYFREKINILDIKFLKNKVEITLLLVNKKIILIIKNDIKLYEYSSKNSENYKEILKEKENFNRKIEAEKTIFFIENFEKELENIIK